jgi:OmcA/MtrC family decaheme c-type cytochrome
MSVKSSSWVRSAWIVIPGMLVSILLVLGLAACGGGGGGGGHGNAGVPGTPPGIDINNATSINAQITGVSVSSPPLVNFRLTDDKGNAIRNLPASSISFTIAKLMPGTDGNVSAWQNYINSIDNGAVQAVAENATEGDLVDHGDGTYTYAFDTDITRVTNPVAVPFNSHLTHRVSFEISGFVPVDNPAYNFRPSDGKTNGLFSRDIVKTASCNRCHEKLAEHGGVRFEVRQCVTCHNPGSTDGQTGNTLDFKVMIHKIHMGKSLPSVTAGQNYCIGTSCYGDVVFPQDVRHCSSCHDASDPETPDAANWYFKPTKEACGACHDTVDFASGEGHADTGIVADNSQCAGCHASGPESPIEVRQVHRLRAEEAVAQFQFNIEDITFGGLGTAPRVDFSITDPGNRNRPYDLASDPEITRSNLAFQVAWNSADYFNEGSGSNPAMPTHTPLISNGALAPAVIDNQDGTYTLPLKVVPNGTSLPITGSGAVTLGGHPVIDTDTGTGTEAVPVTSAVRYFGITDDPANPTPRRQKVDIKRCDNCHERLSLHDGSRNDNTGVCVTCHNPNATDICCRPADPASTLDGKKEEAIDFKYMIHKIHAADIVVYSYDSGAVDFRDVRYPQRLSNCTACHTDDGFYPVDADSGVLATTISTGANRASPLDDINITPNAAVCSSCHTTSAAAAHMQQNGGSFDACQGADGNLTVRVDTCGGTLGPTTSEGCPACHGPGEYRDVAVWHRLD